MMSGNRFSNASGAIVRRALPFGGAAADNFTCVTLVNDAMTVLAGIPPPVIREPTSAFENDVPARRSSGEMVSVVPPLTVARMVRFAATVVYGEKN